MDEESNTQVESHSGGSSGSVRTNLPPRWGWQVWQSLPVASAVGCMVAPLRGFRVTVPSRCVVEIVVLTHILTARRISAMPDWTRKKARKPEHATSPIALCPRKLDRVL